MAVVHGNPGAAEDYVIRLRFPKGYAFPLHWHPGTENLTVLSGVFHLGMDGEKKSKTYTAGDFLYIPGRMAHFGGARTASTIQLHGVGPFAINLGTPK
jgi:quercetin dioxygenase-like cupin family protein